MSPADRVDPVVGRTGARFGASARASTPDDGDAPAPEVVADPAVALTGARFGASRRRRAAQARAADAVESRAPNAEETQAADPALERPADVDEGRQDEPLPPSPGDAQLDAEDDGLIGGVKVRPYVRTGGRTRPAIDLAIEALVSTVAGAPEPPGADHRAIAALCASPRSVAEIAALLEIPLGVARVLVGDLAQDGGVVVHGTSGPDGPDAPLMQRVLDGLRRL